MPESDSDVVVSVSRESKENTESLGDSEGELAVGLRSSGGLV